jgi:hydroxymethylbilane synthase
MTRPLILGTRGSDLALTQARMTEAALAEVGVDVQIEVVKTIGDKRPDLKLSEFALGDNPVVDKGIFTKELEEALIRADIDFAVHSLKDVPTELGEGFEICATLPRADIADVLLTTSQGDGVETGMTVATSSVRRTRQMEWLYPGIKIVDIRGNVPTRIRKLIENDAWDGILLARAGIERLGIFTPGQSSFEFGGTTVYATELEPSQFLPAAGQGAVSMEIRSDNDAARAALAKINHEPTFQRVAAERAFLHRLQAGCQTPVGAWTWFEDDGATLGMSVRVFDEDDPAAAPHECIARAKPDDLKGLVDALTQK